MSMRGYAILAILGTAGTLWAVDTVDTAMNYTDVTGKISKLTVDCFIEGSSGQVDVKETTKLAYVDCNKAPAIAVHFGHSVSDIKHRNRISFTYVSPVDKTTQSGEYVDEMSEPSKYAVGMNFEVKANTSEAKSYKIRQALQGPVEIRDS